MGMHDLCSWYHGCDIGLNDDDDDIWSCLVSIVFLGVISNFVVWYVLLLISDRTIQVAISDFS